MMAITHCTIAAAGCALVLGTADPLVLGLAVLGSQLPDLDTSTSTIGQIAFPISSRIEAKYPHRTITHSLLATLAIALVAVPTGYLSGYVLAGIAVPLGHLLATFSDCFTKQGVQLFFPYPAWCISVSNPRRRLKTGGAGELWVLGIAIALLIGGIYLATGGGITQQVNLTLGLRDDAVKTYNQQAASHQMYANISGVWASDRTRADGRYFIISNSGSEFLVSDGKGIYKTGQQIVVDKLTVEVGQIATLQVQTLTFSDQPALPALQQLAQRFPGAAVYLSGSITVDMPDEVAIAIDPKQYATAVLSGSTLTLDSHPLEVALTQLGSQYAVGTLTVKVISPKP
jgi:inner membrane protein